MSSDGRYRLLTYFSLKRKVGKRNFSNCIVQISLFDLYFVKNIKEASIIIGLYKVDIKNRDDFSSLFFVLQ